MWESRALLYQVGLWMTETMCATQQIVDKQQARAECMFSFKFLLHFRSTTVLADLSVDFFKSGMPKRGPFLTGKFLVLQIKTAKVQFLSQINVSICTICRALLVASLWGAIYICSVDSILLQTSHISYFHRSSPAPVTICCSFFYLYATSWRSVSIEFLGYFQKSLAMLLILWCILPSLVPSTTGRFGKINELEMP